LILSQDQTLKLNSSASPGACAPASANCFNPIAC
jgi:hypothetical protein